MKRTYGQTSRGLGRQSARLAVLRLHREFARLIDALPADRLRGWDQAQMAAELDNLCNAILYSIDQGELPK